MNETPRTDAADVWDNRVAALIDAVREYVTANERHYSEATGPSPQQLDDLANDIKQNARQLERELAEALKWKNEDPRMLREQIRVADVAFNALNDRYNVLREGVEKLAAEYTRLADTSDDEDFITEKRALARELRVLLK